MIPLAMVVVDTFRDSPSMMALATRHQAGQTFLFDRADEPFGVGVGIGCPIGCLDDANREQLSASLRYWTAGGAAIYGSLSQGSSCVQSGSRCEVSTSRCRSVARGCV